ncbi:hypothetical protein WDW89_05230, partial [Deltaproteobacteria bacterium TL4]
LFSRLTILTVRVNNRQFKNFRLYFIRLFPIISLTWQLNIVMPAGPLIEVENIECPVQVIP